MPKTSAAEELARECVRLRSQLRRTGGVLHDDIGSLLAVAGLRLQLAKMDFPDAAPRIAEVSEALEGVVAHVRTLSRAVEPSPVRRTGLKNALLDLAETVMANPVILVKVKYSVAVPITPDAADALFIAASTVVNHAAQRKGVRRIAIAASGSKKISVQISYDAQTTGSRSRLQMAALLARQAGLSFEVKSRNTQTKHGTIVAIRYVF